MRQRERTTRRLRPRSLGLLAGVALGAVGIAACGSATSTSAGPNASASVTPSGATGTRSASDAGLSAQFVTVTSGKSFSGTVGALKHSVSSTGMMVLGNLNQASALSVTGLQLPGAQSFFVGNPTTGKSFFQADPAAGAVLPMRIYVWQNQSGKTQIGYFDPAPLLRAINPKFATGAKKMSMMASQIASGA